MQIRLTNEIQTGQETEVIRQVFDGSCQLKSGWHYLTYTNEDGEKTVLKFNDSQLTMTRFSQPRSNMHFVRGEAAAALLPTPMGLQQLVTETRRYAFAPESRQLILSYDLKPSGSAEVFASYQLEISWD